MSLRFSKVLAKTCMACFFVSLYNVGSQLQMKSIQLMNGHEDLAIALGSMNEPISMVPSPPQKFARGVSSTKSEDDILNELDELTRGTNYTQDAENCLAPKQFYHNRIVRSNSTNSKLIPKIIHVGYKDRCLPQDLYPFMERWETQFPKYSIFLHDLEATERLLYDEEYPEFPNFQEVLNCVLYNGAMTSDIWRVLALWLYGGIYTDIDVWPEDGFGDDVIPADASGYYFSQPRNWVSHWFQAIESKHRMMYDCMKIIIHNMYTKMDLINPEIFKVTGPWVIRDAFYHFIVDDKDTFASKLNSREPANFNGMEGQKIVKVSKNVPPKYRYVTHKKYYQDMVPHPFNATANITVNERIMIESELSHWPSRIQERAQALKDQGIKFNSCKEYLRIVAEDPGKAIDKTF